MNRQFIDQLMAIKANIYERLVDKWIHIISIGFFHYKLNHMCIRLQNQYAKKTPITNQCRPIWWEMMECMWRNWQRLNVCWGNRAIRISSEIKYLRWWWVNWRWWILIECCKSRRHHRISYKSKYTNSKKENQ